MPKVGVSICHQFVSNPVEMEIDSGLLNHARHGNTRAQDKIILLFKEQYRRVHRHGVNGFLSWRGLQVTETQATKEPQGCGCECPGCDQGYHCHKTHKDCYV